MQVDPLAQHSLQTAVLPGPKVHLILRLLHSKQLLVPFRIFLRGGPWP